MLQSLDVGVLGVSAANANDGDDSRPGATTKGNAMRLVKRLVLVKLLATVALLSSCAWARGQWPREDHGGLAPKRAASDMVFVGAGFALDAALAQTKVPAVPRLAADALLAWAVRVPKWGGRTEAAHILTLGGSFSDAWLRGMLKALR